MLATVLHLAARAVIIVLCRPHQSPGYLLVSHIAVLLGWVANEDAPGVFAAEAAATSVVFLVLQVVTGWKQGMLLVSGEGVMYANVPEQVQVGPSVIGCFALGSSTIRVPFMALS